MSKALDLRETAYFIGLLLFLVLWEQCMKVARFSLKSASREITHLNLLRFVVKFCTKLLYYI